MTIARILVPVIGHDRDSAPLEIGFQLARRFGALVDALFVQRDLMGTLPNVGEGMSAEVIQSMIDQARTEIEQEAHAARQHFQQALSAAGVARVEHPAGSGGARGRLLQSEGRLAAVLAHEARLSDLIVAGPIGEDQPPVAWEIFESALIESGRPVLVARGGLGLAEASSSAAVAWDGSLEASRAVVAALPLLRSMERIELLHVGHADQGGPSPLQGIADYFALQGLRANQHRIEPDGSVGEAICGRAAALGVGVLVMGGYGHSRLREWVFGGTTQWAVKHAEVPVLLTH